MPVRGGDIVAKNIIKFGGGFLNHVNDTMNQVRGVMDAQVTKNISLSDHSQADLAKLGHPYASKWGTSKAAALHTPYWVVHSQTGKLLESKYSGVNPAGVSRGTLEASAFVGLDDDVAEHASFVVYGTSKMIPRPVLQESRDQISDKASSIISSNLKNLVTSFRGDETK